MEIEEIGHGTLTYPVHNIAHGTAGDQAETKRLQRLWRSHGPEEKAGDDHHLDSGEHQWAVEEELTEHSETDTRIESEGQVEKWRDLDRPWRHHYDVEDEPFRNKIDRKGGS
jgi:hypothetical protein